MLKCNNKSSQIKSSKEKINKIKEKNIKDKVNNIISIKNNSEIIKFSVNETIFNKIYKDHEYRIITEGLNGCTASFIIIQNINKEQFIISTHFPPIDIFRDKQLLIIKDLILKNISNLGIINNINIFSTTEVSRKNNDYNRISDLITELTGININSYISKYDRRNKYSANIEELGKLKLIINKKGNMDIIHEGKLKFNTGN